MSTEETPKKPRKKGKQAKASAKLKRHMGKKCGFLNANGDQCSASVCFTDGRGIHYCSPHKMRYFQEGYGREMDGMAVNKEIEKLAKAKGVKLSQGELPDAAQLAKKIDDAERQMLIEPVTPEGAAAHRIRFGQHGTKHGEHSKYVELLDLDYYAPDYKDDHIYLLKLQIRRTQARVNLYFKMLWEIENAEKDVKTTETTGKIPIGTPYGVETGDMQQTQVRHIDYYTLRLKVLGELDKAENTLAKLLKQQEELMITALLVLKREGVIFSRDAAMMVLAQARKEDDKPLKEYHEQIQAEIVPEYNIVQETAVNFVPEQLDSDW